MLVLRRYTVVGKLAQGGMAEVYLARQRGPAGYQKLVVIKRVRPHLTADADFVGMFTNEARLAAMISHPNVVQIFDLGDEPGVHGGTEWYLAMEYLDGRDMLQVGRACRALNKAVPFDVTARIIADACAGLDHAHQLRGADGQHLALVHRDMSPENLVITFDGSVKVVDFGIAKAADNAVKTMAGQIKGKLGYVAPEAIRGAVVDARADIFAAGATLYLFLCGRPAFGGTTPMEVFERSLRPPTPPREVNARVPASLDAICMRALAQDPNERYQTAGELRDALEDYLQSTGRVLGGAQIAQFMQILFPPQTDPVRQRIDKMLADVPPQGSEQPRALSLPELVQDRTAVAERPAVPDPVTLRMQRQPSAGQPGHLRSMGVDVDMEMTGAQRAAPPQPFVSDIDQPSVDDQAALANALNQASQLDVAIDGAIEATLISAPASQLIPPTAPLTAPPPRAALPPEFSQEAEERVTAAADAYEHALTSSSIIDEEMPPPPVEASLPVSRPRAPTPPPMRRAVTVSRSQPAAGPSWVARVAVAMGGAVVGLILVAIALFASGRL
jgi:eukaryotic-like serine/threonine-protein kinase